MLSLLLSSAAGVVCEVTGAAWQAHVRRAWSRLTVLLPRGCGPRRMTESEKAINAACAEGTNQVKGEKYAVKIVNAT